MGHYIGGCLVHWGMFSTLGDIMGQYIGGCLVHWGTSWISTLGDV